MIRTRSQSDPATVQAFAVDLARLCGEEKCTDVLLLDVRGISQICDYLIIASGTSDRQMRAVAQHLEDLGKARESAPFQSNRDEATTWVIVDFVMKMLYSGTDGQQGVFGPWNEILTGGDICVVATSTKPLFSGNIFSVPGQSTGGTGGGSVGGGTCQVQTTGACAESNLRIFGTAAANASKICTAESHGNASAVSGTDRLGDAARTPYSFGLFQINITAHRINGLDCPSAFSKKSCTLSSCGPGTGVRVTNVALYNRCAAAAKSLQGNIEVAHRIYRDANSSWSPWGTARGCGLADNGAGKTVAFGTIGL